MWRAHACVRKIKAGWEEVEAYGFMIADARQPVRTYHDKAQPVILTTPAEWDLWLSDAPWPEVKHLQRPLDDGVLKLVAIDARADLALPASPRANATRPGLRGQPRTAVLSTDPEAA